jgi:hypothetical protein
MHFSFDENGAWLTFDICERSEINFSHRAQEIVKVLCVAQNMAYLSSQKWTGIRLTRIPITMVEKAPPMNPSQVLFGLSSMSFVRPKFFPKTYAKTSLITISVAGISTLVL